MWKSLHVKYPLFLSDFNKKKKAQISHFIKTRPVGIQLSHADRRMDRRTDMTKLIVAFRNSADVPKNGTAVTT